MTKQEKLELTKLNSGEYKLLNYIKLKSGNVTISRTQISKDINVSIRTIGNLLVSLEKKKVLLVTRVPFKTILTYKVNTLDQWAV